MNYTHGAVSLRDETKTADSYLAMRQRCLNKNSSGWEYYGGRSIKICARWLKSYRAFLKDMGHRPAGFSLGRIDNEKGYYPKNCRWETQEQQVNNTRASRFIEYEGKRLTLSQWAKGSGISTLTLWKRLDRGWLMRDAISKPTRKTFLRSSRAKNQKHKTKK